MSMVFKLATVDDCIEGVNKNDTNTTTLISYQAIMLERDFPSQVLVHFMTKTTIVNSDNSNSA
jgi:hypothetical protein